MNISISELVVVFLIALLVIKPEQLPDVAYTLGRFVHAIRVFFSKFKKEMNGFIDTAEEIGQQKREK